MKTNGLQKTVTAAALALLLTVPAFSQTSSTHQHAAAANDATSAGLAEQLATLQQKVQHLEHQLQSNSTTASMSGMKMSGKKGMADGNPASMNMSDQGSGAMKMGMKDKDMGMMKMNNDGTRGMKMGDMEKMGKGMGMMGMMKGKGGMSGMAMQSALPGFPGASHIYHIGATGFFLDHGDHIQLTPAQQSALARIKERSVLEQATAERKIDEAEQQLWQLTAADSPDEKAIEAKIREIEKLRGDQRMTYIRAVGEAAETLTHEQHKILTGTQSSNEPNAHTNHQP